MFSIKHFVWNLELTAPDNTKFLLQRVNYYFPKDFEEISWINQAIGKNKIQKLPLHCPRVLDTTAFTMHQKLVGQGPFKGTLRLYTMTGSFLEEWHFSDLSVHDFKYCEPDPYECESNLDITFTYEDKPEYWHPSQIDYQI